MKVLDVKTPSLVNIAKKFDVELSWLSKQLEAGINVEMEHTTNKKVAEEIARDHLNEDPKYYLKLKKVEK
jgi:glucan phosphoethanolaminetransferase (alkaline phosphatase superfamily)